MHSSWFSMRLAAFICSSVYNNVADVDNFCTKFWTIIHGMLQSFLKKANLHFHLLITNGFNLSYTFKKTMFEPIVHTQLRNRKIINLELESL